MRGNAPVFVSRGGNPSGLDGTSGRATLDGGRVQTEPNEPVSPRRRRPRATHGTQPTSRRSRHGAPGDMQGHSGALGGWAEQIELERRHRAQREQQHQQWLETFDLAVAQESTGLRMAERHIRQQQTENEDRKSAVGISSYYDASMNARWAHWHIGTLAHWHIDTV
ncbi:hypothetical protein PoMZ_05081 [Pyricularia oryzae]|uniref:Uncharacterized protein n=1 Tax=Pyricularia oryzae TaxID=318829 RepID=A0A4P7NMR6_PYROR|nr:hypothetical protein PoMZ_05081 [Pyricularia oryzae]